MPGAKVLKDIYFAKSLEELNHKISGHSLNLNKATNLKSLCETISKLYKKAESARDSGDEELAYILYMRYYEVVKHVRSSPAYKNDKTSYDRLMSAKHQKNAIEYATELQSSLSNRYGQLISKSQEDKVIDSDVSEKLHKMSLKGGRSSSEHSSPVCHVPLISSNSSSVETVTETSFSSARLYLLLEDRSRSLLILDARERKDFLESHIKHEMIVNIPEEGLQPGMTAAKIENMLDNESKLLWDRRRNVDYVVLIDWHSNEASLKVGHPLQIIKDAICKWDQTTTLKRAPVILEGGYEDFILHYPTLTTNAAVKAPLRKSALSEMGSKVEVDYPNLDTLFAKPAENAVNSMIIRNGESMKKPLVPASLANADAAKALTPTVVIDRGSKPKSSPASIPSTAKVPHFFMEKLEPSLKPFGLTDSPHNSSLNSVKPPETHTVINHTPTSIPQIDRNLKPKLVPGQDATSLANLEKTSVNSIKTSSLTEGSLANELESEHSLEAFRRKKESEAEEAMRKLLQDEAEVLHGKLNKLAEENWMLKEKWTQAETKLEEKDKSLLEIQKNLETVVNREQAYRDKDLKRLRDDRKRMETEPSPGPVMEPKSSKAKGDMKDLRNQTEKEKEHDSLPFAKGSEDYTTKLKDENSKASSTPKSNLSRCHSSPNIAQMVAEDSEMPRIMPLFDRSLKPPQSITMRPVPICHKPKMSELSAARHRNLSPIYGTQGAGVTGLRNLGNTCFMNSVLQCLSNTMPLSLYFTTESYRADINSENKQGSGGRVAEEYAVVIKAIWTGQYKSIGPADFKNTVSRHLAVCVGNEQQDSHEFLVVLMEKLHGDLNKVRVASTKPPTTDDLPKEEAMTLFWQHHCQRNKSVVMDMFEGLLMSTLKCLHCEKKSNSFEVFSCLSLPISTSKCLLKDCLRLFLSKEKMSGEGAWDCPQCKQKREAGKKMVICQLPNVLVIHLKRFSYEGMWRRKLQTYVDFPLKDLDMQPYVAMPSHTRPLYNLYGVVNHYGTLEGGHYTAYCKNSVYDRWFKFDDHEVTEMSASDVKTSAAYILFYTSMNFQDT